MAAPVAHRACHHRHAGLGRNSLLAEIPVGADRRPRAGAAADPHARTPAQLDAARAGGHRHRAAQSRARRPDCWRDAHGAVGAVHCFLRRHPGHRRRRLAHRVRGGCAAGRDGGGLPDRLSHRADHGQRRRIRDRRSRRLARQLYDDGGAGGRGRLHHAAGGRAARGACARPGTRASRRSSTGWRAARTGPRRCGRSEPGSWAR